MNRILEVLPTVIKPKMPLVVRPSPKGIKISDDCNCKTPPIASISETLNYRKNVTLKPMKNNRAIAQPHTWLVAGQEF